MTTFSATVFTKLSLELYICSIMTNGQQRVQVFHTQLQLQNLRINSYYIQLLRNIVLIILWNIF